MHFRILIAGLALLSLVSLSGPLPALPAASNQAQTEARESGEQIKTIRVSVSVGSSGMPLTEQVDLHLGFGVPLRLYPLGTKVRKPAFAIYPYKSTLANDADAEGVLPGETAVFEFTSEKSIAADEGSSDVFLTGPELLSALKTEDIHEIGFASAGQTDWILEGYRIEVNGKLFAEHDNLNARPMDRLSRAKAEADVRMMQLEESVAALSRLEPLVEVGLATASEMATLQKTLDQVVLLAAEINTARQMASGVLPWLTEPPKDVRSPEISDEKRIRSLEVILTPADLARTGTINPVYLLIGNRRFLLSSEAQPLLDGAVPQRFRISGDELALNPLSKDDPGQIGIGIIGSESLPPGEQDRCRLQRIRVRVDNRQVYDSDRVDSDKQVLKSIAFSPLAFRDATGKIREKSLGSAFVSQWIAGNTTLNPSNAVEPDSESVSEPVVAKDSEESEGDDSSANDNPAVVFIPLAAGSNNSPSRRELRNPNGSIPIVVNIIQPEPNEPKDKSKRRSKSAHGETTGGRTQPARPLTPIPAPVPTLSGIRLNNGTIPLLRDGDQPSVTWTTSGNSSRVASYRVDIFGVLPHKNPSLIGTPLATQTGISPNATSGTPGVFSARPPAVQVSRIRSQLTGAESQYLYAQPKVTALDQNGRAITSGFGSVFPLFPAETPIDRPGANLLRGFFMNDDKPVWRRPSFQVLSARSAPSSFTMYALRDPKQSSTVWGMPFEQDSSAGLTFLQPAFPHNPNVQRTLHNVAVRPANNGEQISIQFEGLVALPSTFGAKPPRGWRLVGHIAFLGGRSNSTARIQTKVTARVTQTSPAFLVMQTTSPITYSKLAPNGSPSPCLLIDMPIRFDLMASNNMAASPHDKSRYQISTFVPNGPNGFASAGAPPSPPAVAMAVTMMISQQSTSTSDAVGVYGLRLVPDYE